MTVAGGTSDADTPAVGDDEIAVENLLRELDDLADAVGSAAAQEELRETKGLLAAAGERGLIDSGVRRLDATDAAEAFIGSVIFASPLLVEDGVFDIASHLFRVTVAGLPVYLIANTVFVVVMTYALLEWTGRDKTEADRLFDLVPTRVVMILVVSFVVAAILMTVWGRVGDWRPPTEAIARITVLWTVGSIGAALGDILSEDSAPAATDSRPADRAGDAPGDPREGLSDAKLLTSLHDQFDDLEASIESDANRHEVRQLRDRAQRAAVGERFGEQIRKYTTRDIAEAFVGGVFFSIPFLVEDGVFDVADYFLSFEVGGFPVFFLANAAFVLLIVATLVYWTGPQDVRVSRPLFGIIPRRLLGIAVVSFLTAAALMTMWGRVDHWREPVVAIARISAVWTVASFGAALGDILPGESSGDDINDDLADLADFVVDDATDP